MHQHTVRLRKAEQKKLAEDAKVKKLLQSDLIAKIVRDHYGIAE